MRKEKYGIIDKDEDKELRVKKRTIMTPDALSLDVLTTELHFLAVNRRHNKGQMKQVCSAR